MITLYQFKTSPFTEKVRRALHYKGLEFEVHEVARASVSGGRYADVSPTGKFPALQDEHRAVWDSTDILYHLDARYGGPRLIPESPRDAALAHALEEWADESLYFYEMTMRLSWENNLDAALGEFAETMPGMTEEQLKPLILQSVTQLVSVQGVGRKPREQVIVDVRRHLRSIDALLDGHDFVLGSAPCIADFAIVAQVNALLYAEEARAEMTKTVRLEDWIARLDAIAPR